jgi:hypothetical protein
MRKLSVLGRALHLSELLFATLLILQALFSFAQQGGNQYNANTRFEQMGTELPTPNTYRTASGAPGKDYWQQKADYDIKAELDDTNQKIIGTEVITYTNKSPDELRYLWLQLDQNLFDKGSINAMTKTGGVDAQGMSFNALQNVNASSSVFGGISGNKEYGYKITVVKDAKTGNVKQNCKEVKQHKKHEGTKVPDKK